MPPNKQDKALLNCPHCGQAQQEARSAFSAVCRKCGQYFRVQEVLYPTIKPSGPMLERKRISCFDCGAELDIPVNAQSTMCKRCSHHIDLHDYDIAHAVSKNFKTKGTFVIQPKGYVFNTEAIVGDAILKGRFLGKLKAERSLTVYSSAEIKGTFATTRLIIPAGNCFAWKERIQVRSAEIAGELAASLCAEETLIVRATGRFFGDVESGHLVVEEGAIVVGRARVGLLRTQSEKRESA
jgi:cytoskeletal protein CcmA (bactofilin family)/DNA-directed RNA polymerase subunit RPC12/RpoP